MKKQFLPASLGPIICALFITLLSPVAITQAQGDFLDNMGMEPTSDPAPAEEESNSGDLGEEIEDAAMGNDSAETSPQPDIELTEEEQAIQDIYDNRQEDLLEQSGTANIDSIDTPDSEEKQLPPLDINETVQEDTQSTFIVPIRNNHNDAISVSPSLSGSTKYILESHNCSEIPSGGTCNLTLTFDASDTSLGDTYDAALEVYMSTNTQPVIRTRQTYNIHTKISATLLPLPEANKFQLPDIIQTDTTNLDEETLAGLATQDMDPGTLGIILFAVWVFDILRYTIGAGALVMGAIATVRLIKARGREEEVSRAKRWFEWAAGGMILFSLALPIKEIFIVGGDGFFLSGEGVAAQSKLLNQTIEFVLVFMTYILGAIAVFSIVASGLRLITFPESDEIVERQKKGFQWGLIGLVLFMVSREFINAIFGRYSGSALAPEISPDAGALSQIAVGFSNFLLYFIGPLALISIAFAAILYTTAGVNEANKEKAKKIIIASITAIILAYSSYTIVAEIAVVSQGG